MRIKRFTAESMKDATEQMKTELGPDAIVLNTRKVNKGGTLNLLGKEMVEITAAIDDVPAPQQTSYAQRRPVESFERYLANSNMAAKESDPVESLRKVAERFENRKRPEKTRSEQVPAEYRQADLHELKSEVETVKGTLREIAEQLKYTRMPALPEHLRKAYAKLVEQDVEEQLAVELVQEVHRSLSHDELGNRQVTESHLLATMAGIVKPSAAVPARRGRPSVITLVGPTGVGKTTTIAKLAAVAKLMHQKDVALVSADTYRIGAIEQLRTFAAIADMPMEVVYRPSEMTGALEKFSNKDVIFLDTVGRSQRSTKELAELAAFMDAAEPDEIHLVLSASTGYKTALDIVERFSVVKPNRILFSKLDEAVSLGPLLSIMRRHGLPVSYVTTGQAVPDDIVAVEPERFVSMVYTGEIIHA